MELDVRSKSLMAMDIPKPRMMALGLGNVHIPRIRMVHTLRKPMPKVLGLCMAQAQRRRVRRVPVPYMDCKAP